MGIEIRGWLTWTLLLPYPLTLLFVLRTANYCARMGKLWRMVGVLVSLMVGILCVGVGRYIAYGYVAANPSEIAPEVYTQPAAGWAAMAGGALIAVLGTWAAFARIEKKGTAGGCGGE